MPINPFYHVIIGNNYYRDIDRSSKSPADWSLVTSAGTKDAHAFHGYEQAKTTAIFIKKNFKDYLKKNKMRIYVERPDGVKTEV